MEKIMKQLETLSKKERYLKSVVENGEQIDNIETMDYVEASNKALCDVLNKATENTREYTKNIEEYNKEYEELLNKNIKHVKDNYKLARLVNPKSILIGMILGFGLFLVSNILYSLS